MDVVPYDDNGDRTAVSRILEEIGWVTPGNERLEKVRDLLLDECPMLVARLDGEASLP